MSEAAVLTERRDHVLVISLNRPDARNAVNGDVARGMEAALDELEGTPELWAGVLRGEGKVFCAGADLKAIASGRANELHTERGGFGGLVRRKRQKPLIAAVHADAFAGGFELAIACDFIVAGETIRFGLPEVKRSLVALAGGLVHLPRLIGEKLALELALLGEPVDAERMYRAGLVSRLVPNEAVLDNAMSMAQTLCENGPLAVRASRQIIVDGADMDADARWEMSNRVGLPVFASEDAREGPRAFIEKRKPVWTGK
jgi:enoyl-CoA hydratase